MTNHVDITKYSHNWLCSAAKYYQHANANSAILKNEVTSDATWFNIVQFGLVVMLPNGNFSAPMILEARVIKSDEQLATTATTYGYDYTTLKERLSPTPSQMARLNALSAQRSNH